VDDDMKRRVGQGDNKEMTPSTRLLVNVAKYVPFFGLVVYLSLRPSLTSSSAVKDSGIEL
jgi:hypothetical protein